MPRMGLENMVSMPVKALFLASGATASLMVSMPNMRMAKPMRMAPVFFFRVPSREVMVSTMPTAASTGEKELGFSSLRNRLPP